jgi:hypothetical protein
MGEGYRSPWFGGKAPRPRCVTAVRLNLLLDIHGILWLQTTSERLSEAIPSPMTLSG